MVKVIADALEPPGRSRPERRAGDATEAMIRELLKAANPVVVYPVLGGTGALQVDVPGQAVRTTVQG